MADYTSVTTDCGECQHKTKLTSFSFETPVGKTEKSRVKTGKLISEIWNCSYCGDSGIKLYSKDLVAPK